MDLLPPRTTTRLDIGPMIQTNSAKKNPVSNDYLLALALVARMKMGKSENRSRGGSQPRLGLPLVAQCLPHA